jgi:hypothetical protein
LLKNKEEKKAIEEESYREYTEYTVLKENE